MQSCVTSNHQGSRRWQRHSRRSSGPRVRKCLNAEARDVFDAFCKELEQSPDSEGLAPTAETPVIPPAPAPETPPAAGAFAPFLRPRAARMDPYLGPLGTFQRSPLQAYPHWCTTMTGAVDVPTFPQFATGDACSRSMDPSLSQILKAPCWGFRFCRVRRISIP